MIDGEGFGSPQVSEAYMLAKVRNALHLSTQAYDAELQIYINAALLDLGVAGIDTSDNDDLLTTAIITYVKMHFGAPSNYDQLERSYNEQKAQMQTCSDYNFEEV